mmetsp:Transcript_57764/g.162942  ORF Transcript_57764/g.162942 Transcript_57764/m.162942 type:complete len:546 (+) Transcript_57764:75-1712(+)
MAAGGDELALQRSASESAVATHKQRKAEIESVQNQRILDTPRTREACKKLGLVLEDLQYRPHDSFYQPGDLKERQQMRHDHYEKKRKDRLAQVLAERAKVIAHNAKKGEIPGVQSGQFLTMLESLFEKEAKRLEGDLKGQLRQHSSVVRENEEQLRREAELQERELLREQRRQLVKQMNAENGEKIRQATDSKFSKNSEILSKIEADFDDKQLAHARQLLAEEERMERFSDEKRQLSNEKSMAFQEKVDRMRDMNAQLQLERRLEGETRMAEMEARMAQVQASRDEENRLRQVRGEEQHLKIMDVRDTKNRIDRVDGYRREELREQIDGNVERITTLLAMKDSLLDQRKARNMKAEATRGSRGLNLRRDCLPGPGQYEAPPSSVTENPCGKIGKSHIPGMVEDAVKGTRANPAPGQYDSKIMANGDRVDQASGSAPQFGKRKKTSYLDDAIKAKEAVPAPGRYEAKTQLDHRAAKMKGAVINDQGLDKYSRKRCPVWARPATETPGPAGYSVDDYTRKEVLRRAQKSLPNLTRDMMRTGVPPKIS